jgi:hypothetical protein
MLRLTIVLGQNFVLPAGASSDSYLKAVAVLGDGRECDALHSDPIAFDENNLYFGTELMWTMKRKAYQKFCSNKAKVKVSVILVLFEVSFQF